MDSAPAPPLAVFCPSPLVEVAFGARADGSDEIHIHAGGQGVWAARAAAALGAAVCCCCPLGGETGELVETLLAPWGIAVRSVPVEGRNGASVEDRRRESEPVCLADMPPTPLDRHAIDDLVTLTLGEALASEACLLTGAPGPVLPTEVLARVAADLAGNGCPVVADLSGEALAAVLRSTPAAVRIDDEELHRAGLLADRTAGGVADAAARLHADGVAAVVVSRGAEPTIAAVGGSVYALSPPKLQPVETRGTGDSMTGALAARVAAGSLDVDAVRSAVAAGALNVNRHGLGSVPGDEVSALAERIDVEVVG